MAEELRHETTQVVARDVDMPARLDGVAHVPVLFAEVMAARAGRPLLIVDIAVPRDVDPAVRDLPGVTLLDINDLRQFAQVGIDRRSGELAAERRRARRPPERHLGHHHAERVRVGCGGIHPRADRLRGHPPYGTNV